MKQYDVCLHFKAETDDLAAFSVLVKNALQELSLKPVNQELKLFFSCTETVFFSGSKVQSLRAQFTKGNFKTVSTEEPKK